MGFNVDGLLTNVGIAYRHIKDSKTDPWLLENSKQSTKSTADAIEHRNRGNKLFQSGNDREALNLYTKSISFAPDNSEELALAYSNRSAVLYRLAKYDLCIRDINLALKKDLSEDVRTKLENRKTKCLAQVESKKKMVNGGSSYLADLIEDDPLSVCRNFDNPLLLSSSSKIKLACDERWGRYMVAAKDIEPGICL